MFLFRCCCGDQEEYKGENEPLVIENYFSDEAWKDITGLNALQAYDQASTTNAPQFQHSGHGQVYLLHDTDHTQQGIYTVGIPGTSTADYFGYALYSYKAGVFTLHSIACEPKKTGLGGLLMHKVMEVARGKGVSAVEADAQGTPEFYVKYYPPLQAVLDKNKKQYGSTVGGKFIGHVSLPVDTVLEKTANNKWIRI